MRLWLLALALALLLAPAAHAAPVHIVGYETGDELEGTEGGTAGVTTIISSTKRTGSFALQVAPTSGQDGYEDYALAPADADAYARLYLRMMVEPTTGRSVAGFHTGTRYGCRVDREPDGSLSLWYKDRTTYEALGQTIGLGTSSFNGVEVHQANGSGGSCAGSCIVTCEVSVNGTKVLSTTLTSVTSGDYGTVTRFRIGASDGLASGYTAVVDDVKVDDSTAIGLGRAAPLYPDGDGALTQWNNSCGGTKWQCIDDFASGPSDDATTALRETTSGNKTTVTMTTATVAATETLTAVVSFGYAKEVADDARDWRLNQFDGTTATNGPTESPGAAAFAPSSKLIRTLAPAGGAWSQAQLNGLQLQIEHRTNTGNIDVTAVLGYADIREPDPAVRQNLQDWSTVCRGGANAGAGCTVDSECPSGTCGRVCIGGASAGTVCTAHSTCSSGGGYCGGDGRLTTVYIGDSRIQGTGLGTCSNNAGTACSTNYDCPDGGICNGTAKIPTLSASRLTQKIGTKSTTILNCGVNANTSADVLTRIPQVLTGINLVSKRYCQGDMPTACTADGGCGAVICGSNDCPSEGNGLGTCALACSLVVGSRVCTGGANAGADCTVDSECPSSACGSYPAPDYVMGLVEVNDLRVDSDPDCTLAASKRGPCPIVEAAATPNATPTPGPYFMPRVLCGSNADCTTGRCANNMSKACDVDGDCPSSTCATAKAIHGTSYCEGTCSNDAARSCIGFCLGTFTTCTTSSDCTGIGTGFCTANASCTGTGTCTTTKVCTGSCASVPCASNDRPDGTSSQCGPGTLTVISGRYTTPLYGTCAGGWCDDCGPPGNVDDAQHAQVERVWNGVSVIANLRTIAATVEAAGRRYVHLVATGMAQRISAVTGAASGWSGVIRPEMMIRDWILQQANAIDLWAIYRANDQVAVNPRCNNNPSQTCHTNADCSGTGSVCLTYPSPLRPVFDDVHLDSLGAAVVADAVGDYSEALAPVCTGDTATGCGRCSVSGASCVGSDTCAAFATGEKCLWTDSVCSGAGKGLCTLERIGSRCTLDLGTSCSSNGDCAGKGTCRSEGLPSVGSGS